MGSETGDILNILSEKDLKEILKDFNISLEERAFLKEIFLRIEPFVLKDSLKNFCKSHFRNEERLSTYFKELLLGDINLSYLHNRLSLAITHERNGISPRFYIAHFSKWLDLMLDPIKEIAPPDKVSKILALLFKSILLDIALCMEAQQAVHVERYKKIFNSSKDAVAVVDLKTKTVCMTNLRLCEMLEISEEELLKKRLSDICSKEVDPILEGKQGDVYAYLKAKKEDIPVVANVWTYELAGKKYGVCVFKDIREEIKARKEFEILERLYNTLSAINILVTTVEDKDLLFKQIVEILKEKGEFRYVGIFEKGKHSALCEKGVHVEGYPLIGIPFKSGRDEYVLKIAASKEASFIEKEKFLLEEIVHDVSFALTKIKKHERLSHLAYYDEITHFPNRIYFCHSLKEMIDRARAKVSKIAVIVMIIDRFDELEHTFGYYWMDRIIRAVASRIKSVARDSDLIARLGRDKFSIAIESDNSGPIIIDKIIARIRKLFKEPLYFNNDEVVVTLSFGISQFPYDAENAEDFISKTIISAERAKEIGGDTTIYYSNGITKALRKKVLIRTSLRKALKRREFVLYYQPKIELATGRLKGAEALIRWIKDGKVISPYKFIPILEESDLIHDVGKWVIEEACAQMRRFNEKGIKINIAVNVSPLQLRDHHSIKEIISVISSCDMPSLEVEITESAMMKDISKSISFLETLSDMGIKTYIDDFGTGYSSLAYLKRLPVYAIKIDREFVKDIPENQEDVKIIKAVLSLADIYNIKTVAEGAETEGQIRILTELGCDFVQGYHFSPPLPAQEFEKYVIDFLGSSSPRNKRG